MFLIGKREKTGLTIVRQQATAENISTDECMKPLGCEKGGLYDWNRVVD